MERDVKRAAQKVPLVRLPGRAGSLPPPHRLWHSWNPPVAEVPLAVLEERPGPGNPVFVRGHFDVPRLTASSFKLEIGGAVRDELQLGLEDLDRLPFLRRTIVLECAGNGRATLRPPVPGAQWGLGGSSIVEVGGTPLSPLLERAGLGAGAREVVFGGADAGIVEGRGTVSYERSLPLAEARDPAVLLVWEMNGRPLLPEHGFPLRLVVPGWYAMASVKWLARITVVTEAFRGFFQDEDYVYEPPGKPRVPITRMRPRAVILAPSDGDLVGPGPVVIHGVAWSGTAPVDRVLVSSDAGASWTAAWIERGADGASVRWRATWTPRTTGRHTMLARAVDRSGAAQGLEPEWNARGYENNAVQRIEVEVLADRS